MAEKSSPQLETVGTVHVHISVYVCVCACTGVCRYVQVCSGMHALVHGGQKPTSDAVPWEEATLSFEAGSLTGAS